ncbi:Uma2 family endonuclease [Gloeobacter violaceus]|uniref:Glr1523 protein n=1 Tax=Gloeobacter violaceus (strain ATCC 29082 / PCC 7421) TaxID=251221 RepID=Q7NKF5_GLOVI|nr:Uma2 family endonuclease [Gloeobacter violaceus]BAC89464.1 glr1523 [Gloeobacter violaceus PCC 7421]
MQEARQTRGPILDSGDHLTRPEFERRYRQMPHLKKAELVEGVVFVPSPVRIGSHGRPHAHVVGWLTLYCAATPGVDIGDNATVRLDLDNEPQPDALLRLEGGTSTISVDGHVEGPPELVAEIAASSASYDLHEKLRAYQRNGVQEYLVWRVEDRQIDWFTLQDGRYVLLPVDDESVIRSRVFPGLWLCVSALLNGELGTVFDWLQRGLQDRSYKEY